ncbi:MAG: helix-turn-helix domain-containing protein [Oscillibacter sp.]|nr:helix-turn-helix domain-containing protein [Oscillibacter sp.]
MAENQYRLGKRKGFTVVYRSVAQDSRLSLKARGLFLLMQSLPDDWKFTIAGLSTKSGAGVKQVRNALEELETVGYLVREQTHSDNGTFAGNTWILQEEAPAPLCQNGTTVAPENPPLCQKALAEKALTENGTLQNTIITNTPIAPKGGAECVSAESPGERRAVTSPGRNAPKWKPDKFERFWNWYRRHAKGHHGRRAAAVRAWDKLKADDNMLDVMGKCLIRQVDSDMWRRGVGIPYASTWLNQCYWEDADDNAPDDNPPEVTGWND